MSDKPNLDEELHPLDSESPLEGACIQSDSCGSETTSQDYLSSAVPQRRLTLSISVTHENKNCTGFEGSIVMSVENNNLHRCVARNYSPNVPQENKSPQYMLSVRLIGSKPPVKRLATDWTNTYSFTPSEALRSILELILHSTGIRFTLHRKQAEKLKYLNSDTFESWMEEPNIYPLVQKKEYLGNISKFMKLTLTEIVLLDRNFMVPIHILLTVMVNSKWRSARFTAVLFGTEISQLYIQFLMGLPSTSQMLKEIRLEEVKSTFMSFLNLVLLCLRDVDLFIRRFTFQVLLKWCKDYSKMFLSEIYLRNIYWGIFDPSKTIRLIAIKTSYTLIINEESTDYLSFFTGKLLPALLLKTHDESTTVAVEAVNSIMAINRTFPDLIEDESKEEIYKLIYCNQPTLSSASAQFLYEVLQKYHKDSVQFIIEITTFLYESEIQFDCKCDHVLVPSMFKYASNQLTDWPAWTNLLLGDHLNKHLKELACRLLICIIRYTTTCRFENAQSKKYFPPVPEIVDKNAALKTAVNIKDNGLLKKIQESVTSHFGQYIVQLLEKYKCNPECHVHLITIPKYFSQISENMDIKTLCSHLIALEIQDSNLLEESISTLAFLHHLMLQSYKFKKETSSLERLLWKNTVEEFFDSCKIIANCPKHCQHMVNVNMIVLKKAFYLSKYFDLTETTMLDDGIKGLQYSKAKLNPKNLQAISIIAPVCLYIVQWQLKNVLEKKFSEDELKSRLYKLQSHIRTIAIQLEYLICDEDASVRQPMTLSILLAQTFL